MFSYYAFYSSGFMPAYSRFNAPDLTEFSDISLHSSFWWLPCKDFGQIPAGVPHIANRIRAKAAKLIVYSAASCRLCHPAKLPHHFALVSSQYQFMVMGLRMA
jgi:hypothetical protein